MKIPNGKLFYHADDATAQSRKSAHESIEVLAKKINEHIYKTAMEGQYRTQVYFEKVDAGVVLRVVKELKAAGYEAVHGYDQMEGDQYIVVKWGDEKA